MLAQFVRSFDTGGNGQLRPAWIATSVSITAVTASSITQTGATITVARSNPAAGTLYLVIVPQGVTPTWSRANIATNSGWTATTIAYHDADTDPGSGTTYVFTPDASDLTAFTAYDLWAVWDDGEETVGPVAGEAFVTLGGGVSFRALILAGGTLCVLPVGQENTGKKPIVLLDGNLKERVGSEGVPIILDAGALRTLGQGESLVS